MDFPAERRRDWRSLSTAEKQRRLEALRRRQERQIQREALRLRPHLG
jgi:hypothetical protein